MTYIGPFSVGASFLLLFFLFRDVFTPMVFPDFSFFFVNERYDEIVETRATMYVVQTVHLMIDAFLFNTCTLAEREKDVLYAHYSMYVYTGCSTTGILLIIFFNKNCFEFVDLLP